MFNKYGLKCTFNINSALLGTANNLNRNNVIVDHSKVMAEDVRKIYEGHEVAAHTLTHPILTKLDEEDIVREIEDDRKKLSELCGYEVVGMAYPCGAYDERVLKIMRERTGIKYSRTVNDTRMYDIQKKEDLLELNPSIYYIDPKLDEVVDRFLALESDEPQLLYIWGHSYEMDAGYITWEAFEALCSRLSGRDDIFYGTNSEVLFG
jgi:peptidoglycan/xylan/chitin deacetylase (PgdA/CDA1 family)